MEKNRLPLGELGGITFIAVPSAQDLMSGDHASGFPARKIDIVTESRVVTWEELKQRGVEEGDIVNRVTARLAQIFTKFLPSVDVSNRRWETWLGTSRHEPNDPVRLSITLGHKLHFHG